MKKIDAIIRKSRFHEVRQALHDVNVYFFSYWDVTGVGHEKRNIYTEVLLTALQTFKDATSVSL